MTGRSDASFKIVLAGNASVGKTSLIFSLIHQRFIDGFHPTVGTHVHDWSPILSDSPCDIKLWDTAGEERYRSLAPIYFRGAHAGVIVFDAQEKDREATERDLRQWITSFRDVVGSRADIILVANKCDTIPGDEIDALVARTRELSSIFGTDCFIVSAKTGEGVSAMFHAIAERVFLKSPQYMLNREVYEEPQAKNCSC